MNTASLAGTTTDVHGRRKARVVIPDRFPAETGELIEHSGRPGRGKTEFVPQTAEEHGSDAERMALKCQTARENVLEDGFQRVV